MLLISLCIVALESDGGSMGEAAPGVQCSVQGTLYQPLWHGQDERNAPCIVPERERGMYLTLEVSCRR